MPETRKPNIKSNFEQDRQLEELLFLAWMYFQIKRPSQLSAKSAAQVA